MKTKPIALAAFIVTVLAQPVNSRATSTVAPGWNLLQTDPASTVIFGENFEGVPLITFDFGGAIGVENVGLTDTLIRRLSPATVPSPGNSVTVATAVDAFQIRTVDPVDVLGPMGIYYATLQSKRGGPISTGTMTINFDPEGDP